MKTSAISDGLRDVDREQVQAVLKHFPSVEGVILYGSRAMGNYKPYSDIDLAIVGNISDRELNALAGELEELPLPYKFDVIALNQVKLGALVKHVAEHGRLFWSSHP